MTSRKDDGISWAAKENSYLDRIAYLEKLNMTLEQNITQLIRETLQYRATLAKLVIEFTTLVASKGKPWHHGL
jgi:hypothetical protein